MYHPTESDKIVLKVGTPNKHITGMSYVVLKVQYGKYLMPESR